MSNSAPRNPRLLLEDQRLRSANGRMSPRDHLIRAATATVLAKLSSKDGTASEILRSRWPGDEISLSILKAATSPGSTTAGGWAAELAGQATSDFVLGLSPVSAAAALFRRALLAPLGAASVSLPGVTANATAAWASELEPIPVSSPSYGSATLNPRKIAGICTLTAEMLKRTSAEASVRASLSEAVASALDGAVFSDTAGDATRPAGLLHGITPIPAWPGGDAEAVRKDIVGLVTAVSAAGAGPAALVMNPAQVAALAFWAPALAQSVLTSDHIPLGTVIALAPAAFAVGLGTVVDFDVSKDSTLVITSPATAMVASGVTADPQRSLFQTNSIALRTIFDVTWSLRPSAAPAAGYVEGATW